LIRAADYIERGGVGGYGRQQIYYYSICLVAAAGKDAPSIHAKLNPHHPQALTALARLKAESNTESENHRRPSVYNNNNNLYTGCSCCRSFFFFFFSGEKTKKNKRESIRNAHPKGNGKIFKKINKFRTRRQGPARKKGETRF
jgi:hypothetical protein